MKFTAKTSRAIADEITEYVHSSLESIVRHYAVDVRDENNLFVPFLMVPHLHTLRGMFELKTAGWDLLGRAHMDFEGKVYVLGVQALATRDLPADEVQFRLALRREDTTASALAVFDRAIDRAARQSEKTFRRYYEGRFKS